MTLIKRKKFKGYSTDSLKGMQEYWKSVLEGITHFLPKKYENEDWSGKAKNEYLKFRAAEILRVKKQLNAIFRELVFRKLAGKNHDDN